MQSESRRKFIGMAIGAITGIIAIGYAFPLVSYFIKPSLQKREEAWAEAGDISGLAVNEPRTLKFTSSIKSGWVQQQVNHDVWAVRTADGSVKVYSPVCPHLGCGYHWDQASGRFKCPCHLSVFSVDGKVLSGPAPRGLDLLPSKVEAGRLFVQYKSFRLGIPQQIEA
jgi:menaquinol-cytochrome c reductase iron-sulfur subunit